ncbi:MAG: BON domain-containing protein, partial [bacterium]|nr:BON domain-containing protein [bacterium]
MSFGTVQVRLLVVAWLLLIGAAVAVGVTSEQNDLGGKADDQLAAAGIAATVEVSGRDITLTGDPDDRDRAEEIIEQIDGVRVVNWEDEGDADAPVATPTTTTAAPSTTAPPTTSASTLPPISDSEDLGVSHLDARLEDGKLTLRGT